MHSVGRNKAKKKHIGSSGPEESGQFEGSYGKLGRFKYALSDIWGKETKIKALNYGRTGVISSKLLKVRI